MTRLRVATNHANIALYHVEHPVQFKWHLVGLLGGFLQSAPKLFGVTMRILNAADRLLVRIPGVQLMAWQFSFELVKPLD